MTRRRGAEELWPEADLRRSLSTAQGPCVSQRGRCETPSPGYLYAPFALRPGRPGSLQQADDRRQRAHELIALLAGQGVEDALIDALGQRLGRTQQALSLLGQLDGIDARILFGAAPSQETLPLQSLDDVGKRR